ncbi:MAG: YesL family protein [Clostridia bacterium]|nr:YesL family protein [Clostridia bacterium]
MFGFFNYSKPGPGVPKRDPNQSRMSIYFELLRRKWWNLVKLNLLYFVSAIPFFVVTMVVMGFLSSRITDAVSPVFYEISETEAAAMPMIAGFDLIIKFALAILFTVFFGLGPVTAGYTYILRNYSREEHVYPVADFFEHAKSNFLQSFCLWIIDLIVFVLVTTAITFYSSMGGAVSLLNAFIFLFLLIYLMMHLYIYQIMITFKLSMGSIFKNSFIFVMSNVPKNMLLLLILVVVHIGVPYVITTVFMSVVGLAVFYLLEALILAALFGFTTNYFVYPAIEKCIKEAEAQSDKE